tara:strand:+ start:327 stop:527 length:201 start_codon:yes stop_codon:yes gene_type:complete
MIRYLSISRVMDKLSIKSKQTIYNWTKEGILKPSYLPNGNMRFKDSDIDLIIRDNKHQLKRRINDR